MKKLFTSMISILLISSVLFMGCGKKRVDAKTATDCLINTVIYNKDADKFKSVFNEDATSYEKKFKESFVSSFKSTFIVGLGIKSTPELDKDIENLYTEFNKRIKSSAKYTVTVKDEAKDSATVTVAVTGISMTNLKASLTEKLTAAVKADPSLATNKDALGKKTVELYCDAVKEADLTKSPQNITIKYNASKKKTCWEISNPATSLTELIKAFYTGV